MVFFRIKEIKAQNELIVYGHKKVRARMGWGPMLPSHRSLCARPRGPIGTNTYSGHLCARDRGILEQRAEHTASSFDLISKRKLVSRRPSGSDLMVFDPAVKILVSMHERPLLPCGRELQDTQKHLLQ